LGQAQPLAGSLSGVAKRFRGVDKYGDSYFLFGKLLTMTLHFARKVLIGTL
jgi:hypothetical protein